MSVSPAVSALSRDDGEIEMRPLEQEQHEEHNYLPVSRSRSSSYADLPPPIEDEPPGYSSPPRTRSPSHGGSTQPLAPGASAPLRPGRRKIANERPLKRRRLYCLLFAIYVPLLVVPWVLTCILNYKPLQVDSYTDPDPYPQSSFDASQQAYEAVRILNSVAALLTVPVMSLMLALGAVVYTQQRRTTQKLSLQQTFALANRGWGDLRTVLGAWRPGYHKGSAYLYFGFALVFVGALHQPLRELLVSPETVHVSICTDPLPGTGYCDLYVDPPYSGVSIGYNPGVNEVQKVTRGTLVSALSQDLITGQLRDFQPLLWNRNGYAPQQLSWYAGSQNQSYGDPGLSTETWIAAVPNGTTTGIVGQDTLRLNSSTYCLSIDPNDFPAICEGADPFVTSYSSNDTKVSNGNPEESFNPFVLDVCVPGNSFASPWTLSMNRQDIAEDLYIRVDSGDDANEGGGVTSSFGLHCHAKTTLGYFTLGNYNNSNQPSEIISFPGDQQAQGASPLFSPPSTPFTTALPSDSSPAPGPLTATALSLFGPHSFLSTIQNTTNATLTALTLCTLPALPLAGLTPAVGSNPCAVVGSNASLVTDADLAQLLWEWLAPFSDAEGAGGMVEAAVFFAGRDTLVQAAGVRGEDGLSGEWEGVVWSVPGYAVLKPSVSLAGVVVVSVLLGMQVLGMFVLGVWVLRYPTWTETLDALALARMVAGVSEGVVWPGIGEVKNDKGLDGGYVKALDEVDGVVGRETMGDGDELDGSWAKEVPRLRLGAEGVVPRKKSGFGPKRTVF